MTKKIRWVIAHEPVGLFLKVAERFSAEVNERTGGAFDIEVLSLTDYSNKYNGGKRITKNDLMALIDTGAIEMSHIYTTWLADYNKDLHVLDLPFLFSDYAHADRVLESPIGEELLAAVSLRSNVRAMSFTYSGAFRIVPANFKADNVSSWAGMRVRTSRSPIAVDTFKLLGAVPHEGISLEEMNTAADKDVIDAGESTYVRVFPLEQHKSFKYINDTAHSLFLTSIIANQDFFKSLPKETQEIMVEATKNAARLEREETVAEIPGVIAKCKAEGVEVVRMSQGEIEKFKTATSEVYDMYKNYFSTADLVKRIKST
jgi:TRAP-type C4-dicarboxylate transport system substrate-binding protein